MKNRGISLFLVLCLICSLVIPVSAAKPKSETTIDLNSLCLEGVNIAEAIATGNFHDIPDYIEILGTKTINEYDIIVKAKTQSKDSLLAEGISAQTIDYIANGQVENELFARSQMTDSELTQMGYSPDEISILRNYDGSPLEKNPQLRTVTSKFNVSIGKVASGNYYATALCSFYWTVKPVVVLAGASDYVSCSWVGTAKDNKTCSMRHVTSACSIKYSDGSTKSYSPSVKNSLSWVQAKVLQSTKNAANGNYIKSGSMSVQVQEQVLVHKLAKTEFTFHYGHSTISPNGGVSFLPNVRPNFSVSLGVSEMFNEAYTVNS